MNLSGEEIMRGLQGIERVREVLRNKREKPSEGPALVCKEGRSEEEAEAG